MTTFGIRVLFTEAATKGVCEKGALRNLAKFTGKHLYQGLFFNKVAGLRPAYLFQKRLCTGAAKVLRKPFLTDTFGGCFCIQKTKLERSSRKRN